MHIEIHLTRRLRIQSNVCHDAGCPGPDEFCCPFFEVQGSWKLKGTVPLAVQHTCTYRNHHKVVTKTDFLCAWEVMRMQRILDYGAQSQNMSDACALQKGSSVLDVVALEGVVEDEMSKVKTCLCHTAVTDCGTHPFDTRRESRNLYSYVMYCGSCAYQDESHHPAGASRRRAGAFPRRAGAIRHPAGASRRRAGVFPRRAGAIRHREEEVSWQTFPACTACVNFVDNAAIEIDKIVTPHKPGSIGSCGSIENVYCLDYIMNDLDTVSSMKWKWMM